MLIFLNRRVSEVFRLLQSSRPIILGIQPRPEMNNHDFQVEREKCLRFHHVRRLALPVGRGDLSFFPYLYPQPCRGLINSGDVKIRGKKLIKPYFKVLLRRVLNLPIPLLQALKSPFDDLLQDILWFRT